MKQKEKKKHFDNSAEFVRIAIKLKSLQHKKHLL